MQSHRPASFFNAVPDGLLVRRTPPMPIEQELVEVRLRCGRAQIGLSLPLILLPLLLLLLLDFGDYQRAHYCNQLACLIVSLALTRWLHD